MRVAICDDNQQDIERIRRYTLRMIDYAVEYVFYTRPEELLRECQMKNWKMQVKYLLCRMENI